MTDALLDSPKLTDRQQQVLDLVQSTIERTGSPPTLPSGLTPNTWGLPASGRVRGLAATRCTRIWLTAPGVRAASPQGVAA